MSPFLLIQMASLKSAQTAILLPAFLIPITAALKALATRIAAVAIYTIKDAKKTNKEFAVLEIETILELSTQATTIPLTQAATLKQTLPATQ